MILLAFALTLCAILLRRISKLSQMHMSSRGERMMCKPVRLFYVSVFIASALMMGSPALAGETHPYQDPLSCDRAPGSIMKGVLYYEGGGQREKIADFS